MEIPRIAGVFDSMVLSEVGSTKLTGNLNQSKNKMAIGYVSVDPCSATGWTDPIALGTKNVRNCKLPSRPLKCLGDFQPRWYCYTLVQI